VIAPKIGLQIGEIGIPRYVDARRQQRATLTLGDLNEDIALSWHKQQRQLGPIPK
jgi:hypothetical protein